MNIEHKDRLASEIARVTRPGGKLALHEIAGGRKRLAHYPVPWASSSDLNFLVPGDELEGIFAGHGFWVTEWVDDTAAATDRFRSALRRLDVGAAPLSLVTLMGNRFRLMAKNLLQNLERRASLSGTW
jgi:hypothetical protein